MDPAAFSLETATALISALTLFLSRLDSRRQRSAEIPNLRDSLIILSATLLAWAQNAQTTNDVVRRWAENGMPTGSAHDMINRLTGKVRTRNVVQAIVLGTKDVERARLTQSKATRAAERILSDDRVEPWQSVRHLLGLYGPELLQVINTAIAERGGLLERLREERLRGAAPEELAETMKSLESTGQKLGLASEMLSEYIRDKLPLNEMPP